MGHTKVQEGNLNTGNTETPAVTVQESEKGTEAEERGPWLQIICTYILLPASVACGCTWATKVVLLVRTGVHHRLSLLQSVFIINCSRA